MPRSLVSRRRCPNWRSNSCRRVVPSGLVTVTTRPASDATEIVLFPRPSVTSSVVSSARERRTVTPLTSTRFSARDLSKKLSVTLPEVSSMRE